MIDFYKYLYGKAEKTDRVNEPDLLKFALVPWDNAFVRPTRGDYVALNTNTYGLWYSGYISNDPDLEYLGTNNGAPVWGYQYEATGDEYILNLQLLGFQPPFVNTSQGAILKKLIEKLVPGLFDTTGIQDGMVIAEYEVDPEKRFSDIVKEFADAAYFRFSSRGHICTYAPIDSIPAVLVIDGNDRHFTPSKLKIKASTEPLINDALVIGDIEPQHYVSEYFVGDGFTGQFPLISSVYGLAEEWLVDDSFTGGSVNSQSWILNDQLNFIQFTGGALNCVGGPGDYATSYLQSTNVIPLEGNLRLTHGDLDIPAASTGIIGGLWTAAPSNDLSTCLYGVFIQGQNFYPIVNGVVDFSQTKAINFNFRYVLRTIANFYQNERVVTEWGFLNNIGTTGSFGGNSAPGTVDYHTIIVEIDPVTGNIIQPVPGVNYTRLTTLGVPLGDSTTFAFYAPVVNNNLNLSINGTAVSYPLQASLEALRRDLWLYPDPPSWGSNSPINDIIQYSRLNGVATITTQAPPIPYAMGQWIEVVLPEDPSFNGVWIVTAVATSGLNSSVATDTVQFQQLTTLPNIAVTPALDGQVEIASYPATEKLTFSALSRTSGIVTAQTASAPGATAADFAVGNTVVITVPADPRFSAVAKISNIIDNTVQFQYLQPALPDQPMDPAVLTNAFVMAQVGVPNIPTGWQALLIGPNEVDSQDGLAPAATINDSAAGRSVAQHGIKQAMFNPGQANLQFFKDTTTQTSDIPKVGDILHIKYRHAGVAMGRVVDNTSVTSEATKWGDTGHRQSIKKDAMPLPRTSVECEQAAAALVSDWGYQHYEGSYECTNLFSLTGEPLSGAVLKFQNLPSVFLPVQQEELHEVRTTFEWTSFQTGQEIFIHQLTFGRPDRMRKALAKFKFPKSSYVPQDSALIPEAIDITTVGTSDFTDDVVAPKLVRWDSQNVYIDIGQDPPAGGQFEVRYSDAGWSPTVDGNNLVVRTTGRTFALPRSSRGKIAYIKANSGSLYSRWPALLHIAFPLKPNQATGMLDATNPQQLVLHIQLPFVMLDVWGIEIRDLDQETVLFHADLTDPAFVTDWPVSKNLKSSPPQLFLYTYNVLGEYSDPYNVNNLALIPVISNLGVDQVTKRLTWQGDGKAAGYVVMVSWVPGAPDADFAHHNLIHSTVTQNQYYQLPDHEFFFLRLYQVWPYNAAGQGQALSIQYQYIPEPVVEFDTKEIIVITGNPSATLTVPIPGTQTPAVSGGGFAGDYNYYLSGGGGTTRQLK